MRYISGALALFLLLFAVAQYNDPDGLFWAVAYGVPALWAIGFAFAPSALRGTVPAALFTACAIIAFVGVYYFWPQANEWWRQDVWWNDEAAREGMGLMIVAASFLFLAVAIFRTRRHA
ncbi:transmembrane 220 family protein [Dichotomicrobium thermohalophilum]|uniref:Transmembrane family 220 protein n=1 Tax=Dichotomicrobium thermohalophilum TaxID=933063 RepID=A0A397PE30_9HYPH|nr:transmembrane 220 family protein [Dichotomicrobium thermohalophilum]RIA45427.1 transmembrane family 220 protein [Dichotomicrobium thermohalophilum]